MIDLSKISQPKLTKHKLNDSFDILIYCAFQFFPANRYNKTIYVCAESSFIFNALYMCICIIEKYHIFNDVNSHNEYKCN